MTPTNTPMCFLNTSELLTSWQGNRALTRRVIAAFPEKELFEFTIGGMRNFAALVQELLAIAAPSLQQMVSNEVLPYAADASLNTKEALLTAWDAATPQIDHYFNLIQDFDKVYNLFGQYEFPIKHNVLYFIENEIHHRGQGYVYLRALGITPPFFWER